MRKIDDCEIQREKETEFIFYQIMTDHELDQKYKKYQQPIIINKIIIVVNKK